jgi:hypothetical protein
MTDIEGASRHADYTWDVDGIEKINALIRAYPKEVTVIASVRASDLPGGQRTTSLIETWDHFIRILAPITGYPAAPKVEAFTWGANRTFQFTDWNAYKKCFYRFRVGTQNAQVPL